MVSSVPEPNDWAEHLPQVPRLARPFHVALPCCGIDGAGWALKVMKAFYTCNNVYDLEQRYAKYKDEYMKEATPPHLGPCKGDILKATLSSLERPVHLLLAGSPCPPWAGNGNHGGAQDQRATVFIHIVKLVGALAKSGELQAVVLENVKRILNKIPGQDESFMSKLVSTLQAEIPEFLSGLSTLKARDYCLAQDRTRVFLRGIRATLCPNGEIPPVLPHFGTKSLRNFFARGLPPVDRKSLTSRMRNNLKDAQAQLKQLLDNGQLSEDDLVCFPLDRANGKIYKRQICKDRVPTLTTSNSYLFISDLQVAAKDDDREFFRFLLPEERFTLQILHPLSPQRRCKSKPREMRTQCL